MLFSLKSSRQTDNTHRDRGSPSQWLTHCWARWPGSLSQDLGGWLLAWVCIAYRVLGLRAVWCYRQCHQEYSHIRRLSAGYHPMPASDPNSVVRGGRGYIIYTCSSIGLCSQRRNNFSEILLAFGRSRLPLRYCDTQLSDGVIELPPLRSGPRCRWKCHPTPAYTPRNDVRRVLELPCRSVRMFGLCPDDIFWTAQPFCNQTWTVVHRHERSVMRNSWLAIFRFKVTARAYIV